VNSLERELGVAQEAALAGGEVILRHTEGDRRSWEKEEDSPVTQADLEANQAILQIIQDAFPEDAILSEETKDRPDRGRFERVWIVDPLDGTKEFVARIPEFAVSVALAIGGEPAVGVVYQPLDRECFAARRGAGSELNGERLSLSPPAELEQCVVLSSRTEMSRGQMEPFEGWFHELRPIGSVALKLAWIAAGRGDLWISTAPKNEWDVCAGDLLVREAGGEFVTLKSGKRVYNQADTLLRPLMAAGSPGLVEAFRQRSRHL
jgi:myo-inositol-1(or 4)-monophosphatase